MHVEIFMDSHDRPMTDAFESWRARHPDGYLLNCASGKATIHRSRCGHFEGYDGESRTSKMKVCGRAEVDVRAWAATEGVGVVECTTCLKVAG